MSKREELFLRAKEIKNSDNKNHDELSLSQLEKEIAGLYHTLPMEWLEKGKIQNANSNNILKRGFLYNIHFGKYVSADSNGKFLYANKEDIADAPICFTVKYDSDNDKWELKAVRYFNWRNLTGACKLENPYTPISIDFISDELGEKVFQIFALNPQQYAGCWSRTNDELYVRASNVAREFQFKMINYDAFTEDDIMIYDIMVKQLVQST